MMKMLLPFWGTVALALALASSQATDEWVSPQDADKPITEEDVKQVVCPAPAADDLIPQNPLIHKSVYKIGVHAIRGLDAAYVEYQKVYEDYLTETAGKRFDPPIEFKMVANSMNGIFDDLANEDLDFVYVNPSLYSCIGVEYGAQPIATIVKHLQVRGLSFDLDVFGGVVFTRGDNHDINDLKDLKGKTIGAGSLSMINGGQLQLYEMQRAGMSYVMDPKQVIFTHDQDLVVDGVLNGDYEVGFVRTGSLERATADMDAFKVLNTKVYVMDDGTMFPFLHSTDIYPEWPVGALPSVPSDVAMEVQKALLEMKFHAETSKDRAAGFARYTTNDSHCEFIDDLSLDASIAAEIAGFRNPKSYFEVRTMQEAAGFVKKDERGDWQCVRVVPGELYGSFDCPAGHFKISPEDFETHCTKAGLPCPDGYDCYCQPCVKAHDVEVYHCDHNDTVFLGSDHTMHVGCDKMSVCGSTQQQEVIEFKISDNMRRLNAVVNVTMHFGAEKAPVKVTKVAEYKFKFEWSNPQIGMGIMQVSVDGEQISQSPFQVEVRERDCELDFPGHNMRAAADGNCQCADNTFDIAGQCVSSTIVAVIVSVGCLVLAFIAGFFFIRYKNYMNDQVWMVAVEELHFDDPVEVIGQGSFGVVLKAEYRGTKVAIKKAIKYKGRGGSTKTGSHQASGSKGKASLTKPKNMRGSLGSAGGRGSVGSEGKGKGKGGKGLSSLCSVDLSEPGSEDIVDSNTDPELGLQSATNSAMSNSGSISLSFMGGSFGRRHGPFSWLFFWQKEDDYRNHFKNSILGQSASSSKKTVAALLCPWFNRQARREEEFMAEMRVLSRLRHPCITTVMGAVVSRKHEPMLVMEFMEYGSLHDILRNDTMSLAGEIILQICRDVAQGLRYLHTSKPPVLHGDMKANNILIDSRFRAKLCDFGLSNKNTSLVTGTPFWMAPEYLIGRTHYNTSCDIYAVGIIMWEIYSRTNPYEGENYRHVLRKVCDRRVNKRPDIDTATFPPKMVELMKSCWNGDPSSRPSATNLDTTLMEMGARDCDPLEVQGANKSKQFDELFPKHIAAALKAGQKVEPEEHPLVTVFFSEIINFKDIAESLTPEKICALLDRLFKSVDVQAKKYGIFKVETVGDNYMGVTNLDGMQDDTHVRKVAEFAIAMVNEASRIAIDEEVPEKGFVSVRAGFHCGSVVSNVIGSLNPRYGLFGDTVNTASRMESNSGTNRILCSEYAHSLLRDQAPDVPTRRRGKIQVKGKGQMTVYWIGDKLITAGKKIRPALPGDKKVSFDVDDGSDTEAPTEALDGESAAPAEQAPTVEDHSNSPSTMDDSTKNGTDHLDDRDLIDLTPPTPENQAPNPTAFDC